MVVATGPSVTRFRPGDEVHGIARGSLADLAAAEEHKLAPKPPGLSFAEAAIVAASGMTALRAVRDVGRLQPGQTVLALGASGGVGSYAVQLAAALGGEVTGVSSAAKVDRVRALGADHVVAYDRDDLDAPGGGIDLIVDAGGGRSLRRLRRMLAPAGTLVLVGSEQGGRLTGGFGRHLGAVALSPFVPQRLTMLTDVEHHRFLDELRPFLDDGSVRPVLDRTFPLDRAADALRHLGAGHVRGKVAVTL